MGRLIFFLFALLLSGEGLTPEATILAAQKLQAAGDMDEAERLLVELLSRPGFLKNQPAYAAIAYSDLGALYQDVGKTQIAEHAYRKAEEVLAQAPRSSAVTEFQQRISNNLASLYLEVGLYGKAERIINELTKAELTDPDLAARAKGSLASLYMVRGRQKEAEALFLELVEYWDRRANPKHAAVALNNLGVLAIVRNDSTTAVSRLRRAVDLWTRASSPGHPSLVAATANYACALIGSGKTADGVTLLAEALASARRWSGTEAPMTIRVAALYAEALERTGRKKQARSVRAEIERVSSTMIATDPATHTIDVLDLAAQSKPKHRQ